MKCTRRRLLGMGLASFGLIATGCVRHAHPAHPHGGPPGRTGRHPHGGPPGHARGHGGGHGRGRGHR